MFARNLSRFARDAGRLLTTEMIPAQRQMASFSHMGKGQGNAGSVDGSKEDKDRDTDVDTKDTKRETMCIDDYDDCPSDWGTHLHPKKDTKKETKWYLTHHELHLKFWPQDEYEDVTKKKDTKKNKSCCF